eukprot:TRINITY_DN7428_c0_g1_i1.p1 TRINITY_DN7428_c0_g1~~TRINITY_DN7428_c0_g1_i1.p1  ORF type:complete len:116 (+),score=26.62 TRINITY_DN7428_c0_g1_i1:51-350(+)
MSKLFTNSMNNKIMFVIPSQLSNNSQYFLKITDSWELLLLTLYYAKPHNSDQVWLEMDETNTQVEIFATSVEVVPAPPEQEGMVHIPFIRPIGGFGEEK